MSGRDTSLDEAVVRLPDEIRRLSERHAGIRTTHRVRARRMKAVIDLKQSLWDLIRSEWPGGGPE